MDIESYIMHYGGRYCTFNAKDSTANINVRTRTIATVVVTLLQQPSQAGSINEMPIKQNMIRVNQRQCEAGDTVQSVSQSKSRRTDRNFKK